MKKFYSLLLAAVFAIGANASAQVTSVTSDCSTEYYYVGYNIVSVDWNIGQSSMEEAFPLKSAIAAGWNKRQKLDLTSFPLYLDYGANLTYMFGSYSDEYKEDGYKVEYKTAVNMASVNVPVAVTTPFQVDKFVVLPYVGLNARLNLFGELTESAEASGYGETFSESDSVNLFDVDDMDDYPVKRFQLGLNLGVNVQFDNYTVGLGYIKDFAPAFDAEELLTGTFGAVNISVGYKF